MRVLHVISDFRLHEPQLAVLEFCRVARMRGIETVVLALSDEGEAARRLFESHLISTQVLGGDDDTMLRMQLEQNEVSVVHTHTEADFSRLFPVVIEMNTRMVHTFHGCTPPRPEDLPAGSGFIDRARWVSGTPDRNGDTGMTIDELCTVPDGVWCPPIESLQYDARRREMDVEDAFVIGVRAEDGDESAVRKMSEVGEALASDGHASRMVIFGPEVSTDAPDGIEFVSSNDPEFLDRLDALDAFVQLHNADFCQISLLALARRVPAILPGPEKPDLFRGGWSPFRFRDGDSRDLADQVLRYANDPEMHQIHRSLVRDYVLVFRDSMSMVGAYARLYRADEDRTRLSPTGE